MECHLSGRGLSSEQTSLHGCLKPAGSASWLISSLFAGEGGTRPGGQLEESFVTQFALQRSQSVWQELIGKLLPLTLDLGWGDGGSWAWLGGAPLARPTSLSALWELLPAGEHLALVIGQSGSSLIHAKLYCLF